MTERLGPFIRSFSASYITQGVPSTFVNAWQNSMRIHEALGENRIRFSQRLNEMSEELANIAKEVDKNRKSVRLESFI